MKKLRVLVLMHESLVPPDTLAGYTPQQIEEWKTEYDVMAFLREAGHEVRALGLYDTRLAIAIPYFGSAFGVFLMRQGMDTIPNTLIEAAHIDGSGEFHTFITIVFPNVKAFVATQAIIKFLWSWNEFYWPMVITNRPEMKVITNGIQAFTSMYYTEYNLIMAVAVMSIVPMVLMFAIFQKGIVQAIAMSGIKG